MASKISEKASVRQGIFTMGLLSIVAENFALRCSFKFLNIFVHISGAIKSITLIWRDLFLLQNLSIDDTNVG